MSETVIIILSKAEKFFKFRTTIQGYIFSATSHLSMVEGSAHDKIKLFSQKISSIRKSKKLSLEMLANMAEIDLSRLHRIEAGKTNPKILTVFALAEALGVSPKEFF